MKRYLITVTIFLTLIAVIVGLAEVAVRHLPNSYRFKSQWIEANAPKVNTLILGESHTYYAIIPELLGDSAFSLANVSQTPEYDYWLLERYASRCHNLKTVVMPVDEINVFDPPLEEGEEWYRCIYYRLYMGYPKHNRSPKYNFEICNIAAFNMKLWPALTHLFTGKASLDCDSTGFGNAFTTPARFDEVYMQRDANTTYNRNKNAAATDYNRKYFEKIARLCQKRGIRLVLVTTPLWEGYVKKYDRHRYDVMHEVARHCVNNWGAQYLDYMNDPRFKGTDFHDASHLSRQGAEKFTTYLRSF